MLVGTYRKNIQELFLRNEDLFKEIENLAHQSGLTKWIEGKTCFITNESTEYVECSLYGLGNLSFYLERGEPIFQINEFDYIFNIVGAFEELSEYNTALMEFIRRFTSEFNARVKKITEERIEEYKWFSDFYKILRGKFGKVLFSYVDLSFYIVDCSTVIIIKKPMYFGAEMVREFDKYTIIMDMKGFRGKDVSDLMKEINEKGIFERLNAQYLQCAFGADNSVGDWLLTRLISSTFKNERGLTNKRVIEMFKGHFDVPAFDILYTTVPLNFEVKNEAFSFKVKCYKSDYGCYMVDVDKAEIILKGTLYDIKQKIINSVSQSEFTVMKA
ncbi:hypothetical protein [Bacillus toyonensis]|uniref:hypothetical protein n=1 Tax=Bacillus toyonensis TaxID=155322 RepID=UPI002E2351D1|nr:hypothetical protein [Bacillus toyonensis]